jgi:hypothetical protein
MSKVIVISSGLFGLFDIRPNSGNGRSRRESYRKNHKAGDNHKKSQIIHWQRGVYRCCSHSASPHPSLNWVTVLLSFSSHNVGSLLKNHGIHCRYSALVACVLFGQPGRCVDWIWYGHHLSLRLADCCACWLRQHLQIRRLYPGPRSLQCTSKSKVVLIHLARLLYCVEIRALLIAIAFSLHSH